MITLDTFVNTWNGKQLEVAGSANAKFQCVDLANGYLRDVLGFPIIEHTDAKDFPSKAGNNFDIIPNTPTAIPQKGDLMIWSSAVGEGHGHISIFLDGDVNSFKSFDQNWVTKERCSIQIHKYSNVICFMRPKSTTIPVMITDQTKIPQIVDENNNPMEVQRIRSILRDQQNALVMRNVEIQSLKEQLSHFQDNPVDIELETKVQRLKEASEEYDAAQEALGII